MKKLTRLIFIIVMIIAPVVLKAQWQILNFSAAYPQETKFFDYNKGAVLTATTLLLTTDGGVSFDTAFYRPDIVFPNSLNFIDSSTLCFLNNNKLFITSDFGTIWDSVMLPQNFNTIVYPNDTVFIGRAGSTLLRSNNRGITWQPILSGFSSILFSYEFPYSDTGYVQNVDTILITYDGGTTWSSQLAWPGFRIYFPSDSTWYGIQYMQDSIYIIKTTDKGATWTLILQAYTPLTGVTCVRFPDKLTGYIGGSKSFSIPVASCGVVLGTGDGGDSWDWHMSHSCFGEMVVDIHCLNPDTVYALDLNGVLFRTTNGTNYVRRVENIYATTPLYEPCGKGSLGINLNFPASDTLVVYFDTMYGTATNGVDFILIPDSVIFLPGMQFAGIPILVIDDTLTEGAEFFTVVINNTLYNDTATFWIHDEVPVPLSYQINPPERIVCPTSPPASFSIGLTGGATPYSVIWYDTSGILSQQHNLPDQPLLPWHRTIYIEIIDNALCTPILDSVKIYFFDSCSIAIQSSHLGPVPVGVPVTYTLHHDCPTATTNNQWLINQQGYAWNTNQMIYTWTSSGLQQVNAIVVHPCGNLITGIAVDVITGIEEKTTEANMMIKALEYQKWQIIGERLSGSLTLRVMNMKGQLVGRHHLATDGGNLNYTLDLNHLAGGIYLLDILSENGFRFSEKIVCYGN